jgi:hypothetical protein
MSDDLEDRFAILAAVPLRHLRSAVEVCAERGRVALPATGRGDLDAARPGEAVYLYAYQVGDRPVPAATWRAVFVRTVEAIDGDHPEPELTPSTLRDDRVADAGADAEDPPRASDAPTDALDDDDELDPFDDDDELAGVGPTELFLEVAELRELAKGEWLFTNELVPKRERRARTFVPVAPARVLLPD